MMRAHRLLVCTLCGKSRSKDLERAPNVYQSVASRLEILQLLVYGRGAAAGRGAFPRRLARVTEQFVSAEQQLYL